MKYKGWEKLVYSLSVVIVLVYAAEPTMGVILHPDGEPNWATWTDRPDPNVLGRWGTIASCVAVSADCVIATKHQAGGVGTPVEIAGATYLVAEIWNHSTADLRIAKLDNACLTSFVGIYDDSNEVDKDVVIGGFGDGRGTILENWGITYGYEWDNSTNTTLRMGQNRVDDTDTLDGSDVVIADFDGLGEGGATDYEATIADHDSGSGWFIKVGDQWKVAGLSQAVEIHYEEGHYGDPNYILYEAWFRERANPLQPHPDYLDAVRVSSYAAWISQTMPVSIQGDLTEDGCVDFADFAIFASYWLNTDCQSPSWCDGADFEPDGDVDCYDLQIICNHWLEGAGQ